MKETNEAENRKIENKWRHIFSTCFGISMGLGYYLGSTIGTGITIVIFLCILYGRYRKIPYDTMLKSGWANGKTSFVVVQVFLLIGALSAIWILCGSIPGIVYYGIQIIKPEYYYVLTFVVMSAGSMLLGSSFGSVSTIGVALMALGRGLGVDPAIAGGAIIAGAYVGDRNSPVSSSALLVATITGTDRFRNLKNMIWSSIVPLVLSCILYVILSHGISGMATEPPVIQDIRDNFSLSVTIFVPILCIIICSILRVKMKMSIIISIITGIIISIVVQHANICDILHTLIFGYEIDKDIPMKTIIRGGGVVSMVSAGYIVFISCVLAGILSEIHILDDLKSRLARATNRCTLFINTMIAATISAMFGCNQSISVVMTNDMMGDIYKQKGIEAHEFAHDIENSSIVIPLLIPWNIAAMIPALNMLDIGSFRYIIYEFYAYLLPLCWLLWLKMKKR